MLLRWKSGPYPKETWGGSGARYAIDQATGNILGDVPIRDAQKMVGTGQIEAVTSYQEVAELQERMARHVAAQPVPPTVEECILRLLDAVQSDLYLASRLDGLFGKHEISPASESVASVPSLSALTLPPEDRSVPMPTDDDDEEDPFFPRDEDDRDRERQELQEQQRREEARAQGGYGPVTYDPGKLAEAFKLLEDNKGQGRKPLYAMLRERGMAMTVKESAITMIGRLCGLAPGWEQQG